MASVIAIANRDAPQRLAVTTDGQAAIPVGGTDTYGNLYLAGSVSYGLGGATYFAAQSNLGGFVIYSAASEAGPWTNVGGMGSDAGGDLLLNSVLANIALQPGAAQTVIVGGPTRATLASLEVEGAAALENAGLPSAVVGYAQPFASSGHLNYVAGATGDGNTYDTGRLTLEATGQLVNAAAFVPITGIGDIALGVGTYHIRGRLLAVPNVAGGSVELRFTGSGGLVTSSFAVTVREFTYPVGGGAMGFGNGQTVGLGATFTGALVGAGLAPRPIDFEGRAVVTTAGTLTPQVATTVAADTYNVAVPTDVEILPVVA